MYATQMILEFMNDPVVGGKGILFEYPREDFIRMPWRQIVAMLNASYEVNERRKAEAVRIAGSAPSIQKWPEFI